MRLPVILSIFLSSLLLVPVFAQDTQDDAQVITSGTYAGIITDNNITDRYAFELAAGQEVTITMAAAEDSTLDSQLFLFDGDEEPITNDDDSGENRNAQIIFTAEIEGVYIVEATRFRQDVGTTSGEYLLTLSIADIGGVNPNDPLSLPPPFTEPSTTINLGEEVTGSFRTGTDAQYYVIGAEQGSFLRIEMISDGTLDATVTLFTRINQNLSVVSRPAENTPTQEIIFATIPQTAWYLIEVRRAAGTGEYVLSPTKVSDSLLSDTTPTEATFDGDNAPLFFVFNATINERVFVNLSVVDGNGIIPELTIFDINLDVLEDPVSSQGEQTRISLTAPRSGPYIVQAQNLGSGSGTIRLQIRRTAADIGKLDITDAAYNSDYRGFISNANPIDYYRFSGKAGELVTIELEAIGFNNNLDPYIILADSNLNELIFNDNLSSSNTARVAQYALPADGDYFILATRSDLSRGITTGTYQMDITVGEIKLEAGLLTMTLTWEGEADLNLFVQTPPSGFTISRANPRQPDGGTLQIDSNDCDTPTAQPIEHIYWDDDDPPALGDYEVWVWYQDNCDMGEITPFTLTIAFNNQVVHTVTSTERQTIALEEGERFETSIRLITDNNGVVVNQGTTTTPSPQETASQGGDILLVYGDTISGSITDEVFARFYQFEGVEGDTITITAERITGNLDPIIVLRDSVNLNLASNDDIDPTNRNAQLTYILETDGQYVIAVTRFGIRDGTTTGNYNLSLRRQE